MTIFSGLFDIIIVQNECLHDKYRNLLIREFLLFKKLYNNFNKFIKVRFYLIHNYIELSSGKIKIQQFGSKAYKKLMFTQNVWDMCFN